MPDFIITSPDGQKFRIHAPDGATADQLPDFGAPEKKAPPETSTFLDTVKGALKGAAKGFGEFMAGGGQSEADVMNVAGTGDRMEGVPTQESVAAVVPPSKTIPGRIAESVMEVGANPASWLGPGSVAGKAAANVVSGTAAQLAEEAGGGAVGRFAAGTLAPASLAVPRAVAKAIAPKPVSPAIEKLLARLRAEGIEPTAGDVRDSKSVRFMEEQGDYPLGAKSYSRNIDKVARQVGKAASKFMGANDEVMDAPVFNSTKRRLQNKMDDIAAKLPWKPDAVFENDVLKIIGDLQTEGLPESTVTRVKAQIENVVNAMQVSAGQGRKDIKGSTYQALTRKDTPLSRAMDDPDPNVAYYANRLRDAIDENVERTANAPGTRAGVGRRKLFDEMKEARKQWYAMLVLSKSVDDRGYLNLAKLRQNLTNTPDNKWNWAANRTDLHQFGRDLRAVIKPNRSSLTTERMTTQNAPIEIIDALRDQELKRTSTYNLVKGAIGRTINSETGQRYLKGQLPVQQGAARMVAKPRVFPPAYMAPVRGVAASDAMAPDSEDALQ